MARLFWVAAIAALGWGGWQLARYIEPLVLVAWSGGRWIVVAKSWHIMLLWPVVIAAALAALAMGWAIGWQLARNHERWAVQTELEQALRDAHEAAQEASEARQALAKVRDYQEHLKKAAERDSLAEEARRLRILHSREREQLREVRRLAQLMQSEIRKPEPTPRNLARLGRKIIETLEAKDGTM